MNSKIEDLELKPLLLVGGQSSRMGTRKELLPFPDGLLAFEHSLDTLHSAVPSATTIYISLHEPSQFLALKFKVEEASEPLNGNTATSNHDHDHAPFPALKPIFDDQENDIGPAAGLLAAHTMFPDSNWLVLGCDYPLLPPTALQQLVLEYSSPVTCFLNENGFAEPLLAIWSPEALQQLKENVAQGRNGMNNVIKQANGKMIPPLRQEWIMGAKTKEEWEEAMKIVESRNIR
jgi:molybdopterin-guanine dinucleotide biosynthesis protein A